MVKVERSSPAPESLAREAKKAGGKYNCPDVTERLNRDFHNKCYLCEVGPLQDPQVEHLLPHKGGKLRDRMFDWENLFWSCGHCNRVKNSGKYDDGILDCCKVDPEAYITSEYIEDRVLFSAAPGDADGKGPADAVILRTVMLLNEVYNKQNTGMRIRECAVRTEALAEEMNVFYDTLETYRQDQENRVCQRALKAMLSRESVFAAFKRGYIRSHCDQYPKLAEMAGIR